MFVKYQLTFSLNGLMYKSRDNLSWKELGLLLGGLNDDCYNVVVKARQA